MNRSARLAVAVAALSFFVSTLDTGIVNVALPRISTDLRISAATASWCIGGYALALSVTIMVFGLLADRIGAIRVSVAGFTLFVLFSIGCSLAPSAALLIIFRALTGIAAAMLQATASSFVTRYVEARYRGSAFGWVSAVLSMGVVLGPSIGGFVVSFASWRLIFAAPIPVGIVGVILNGLLRNTEEIASRGSDSERSLRGALRAVPFVGAAALGVSFIAVFVGAPFELTGEAHLPEWQIGLILLATPVGAALAARFVGSAVQRGAGIPVMIGGLSVDAISAVLMFLIPPNHTNLFVAMLFLFGLGSGALQTPVIALALAAFGADAQARAGALQRFVQNLGISSGALISGALVDRTGPRSIWILTLGICVSGIVVIAGLLPITRRKAVCGGTGSDVG